MIVAASMTTWIEVGSICTGVGALITGSLAGVTAFMAKKTKALADDTQRLATATEEDVSASWRPVLIVRGDLTVFADQQGGGLVPVQTAIRNVGKGPALNPRAYLRSENTVEKIDGFLTLPVLTPGDTEHVLTYPEQLCSDAARNQGGGRLVYTLYLFYEDLADREFYTLATFAVAKPGLLLRQRFTVPLAAIATPPRRDLPGPPYADWNPRNTQPD
jgi:hypothetical protein